MYESDIEASILFYWSENV